MHQHLLHLAVFGVQFVGLLTNIQAELKMLFPHSYAPFKQVRQTLYQSVTMHAMAYAWRPLLTIPV